MARPVWLAVGRIEKEPQQVGSKGAADRVHEPDQKCRKERAADRADAADHDDHEGEDQDVVAHAGLDGEDRRHHRSRKARQHGAEAEHHHEQPLDVDAERRNHGGVAGACAHQHADARVIDEHVEQGRDDEACRDDGEAIDRVEQTARDLDRARKELGNGNTERRRTPDELHALVQEQDHAESGEHLIEMIAVVEVAEDQNFEEQARRPEPRAGREAAPSRSFLSRR